MSDVLSSLQSALADRYRIERELGEGGMILPNWITEFRRRVAESGGSR